jgi:hypothetical protein
MMRRIAFPFGIAVVRAVAVTAACGNYRPNGIEFRFTPVPVMSPYGTPVSLTADCRVFPADQVDAALDVPQRKGFERWLNDIGFTVRGKVGPEEHTVLVLGSPISVTDRVDYSIRVPLGSVPDAITLIKKQPGVIDADANYYGTNDLLLTGPDLATQQARFEAVFGCKPPV